MATPLERDRPADTVAGFLATAAIAVAFVALVYRPVRLAPVAIVVALAASAIGGRHARLAALAVAVGAVCFVAGMTISAATDRPLF